MLPGSEIYRVEKLMFVNLRNAKNPLEIAEADSEYVEMMKNLQNYKSFFFSYALDLTKSIQN